MATCMAGRPDAAFKRSELGLKGRKKGVKSARCQNYLPKKFKDEIDKAIQKLLDMGHIRLLNCLVLTENDGTLKMYTNY